MNVVHRHTRTYIHTNTFEEVVNEHECQSIEALCVLLMVMWQWQNIHQLIKISFVIRSFTHTLACCNHTIYQKRWWWGGGDGVRWSKKNGCPSEHGHNIFTNSKTYRSIRCVDYGILSIDFQNRHIVVTCITVNFHCAHQHKWMNCFGLTLQTIPSYMYMHVSVWCMNDKEHR